MAIQSAVAGTAAWLATSLLFPPHASWAVISAIFVVSQSSGRTLRSAIARVLGTVSGTLIGFLCILAFGGPGLTILRIALAALGMSALASFKPDWRFGIVAAVIVALEQDETVLGGAIDRAIAILIGTATGVGSAFLIWRESAERRIEHAYSVALSDCRALLGKELDSISGKPEQLGSLHNKIIRDIENARSEAPAASPKRRDELGRRIHAIERLWHALIIIDRAGTRDWSLPTDQRPALRDALGRVRSAAGERLAALENGNAPGAPQEAGELENAVEEATRLADPTGMPPDKPETAIGLGTLAFAIVEVKQHIQELEALGATDPTTSDRSLQAKP